MDNCLASGESPQDELEPQGRNLGDLSADMLVSVFLCHRRQELFEVMLVNKHWETAMTEDHSLWNKVEVARSWLLVDTGGEGDVAGVNQMASRVLGAAKSDFV